MTQHRNRVSDFDMGRLRAAGFMRGVLKASCEAKRRVVFAEGHDRRVLRAVQAVLEEGCAVPILIGDRTVVTGLVQDEGLRFEVGNDVQVISPQDRHEYRDQWLREKLATDGNWGVSCRSSLHSDTRNTPIAARLVNDGLADSLVCGTSGHYRWHLAQLNEVLGIANGGPIGAISAVVLPDRQFFFADTLVHRSPTARQIANIALAATEQVQEFGLVPRVYLCADAEDLEEQSPHRIMASAKELLSSSGFPALGPITIAGALQQDVSNEHRCGDILVFASTEAARSSRSMLCAVCGALEVGPILMGFSNRAHVVTASVTSQALLNIAALAGKPRSAPVQRLGKHVS